jgi:N-acetylglucosaminyl-diphospho-decaprenol L-rhamnosyltransferase
VSAGPNPDIYYGHVHPHADLAIVIVSYNSSHVIGGLLDSLPDALDGLTADVVVIDNSSTDGTAEFLRARDDCRVVASPNVGYAGGINRGVREAAPAPAILILNPDARLVKGSIPPLLEALGEPHVGIAAPQVRSAEGGLELSLRREPTLGRALGLTRTGLAALSEHVTDPAEYESPHVVDWALGAVLLVSSGCYQALGGWDESFFLYSEETDFCLRARDIGLWTKYEPRSVAVHIGGQSGQNDHTHAMRIVNRVRLYRRRHSALASWGYYWLTVASEVSWILRGHREARASVAAVLRPSRRPSELGCSDRLLPR